MADLSNFPLPVSPSFALSFKTLSLMNRIKMLFLLLLLSTAAFSSPRPSGKSSAKNHQTMEKFVVAKLFIKREATADFHQALEALAIVTRKEPGCISYTYYAEPFEAGAFTLIERYRSKAGLQYHFRQAYLADFIKKMDAWKTKDPEVHFLSAEPDALKDDK